MIRGLDRRFLCVGIKRLSLVQLIVIPFDTVRPDTDTFAAFVVAHFDHGFDFATKSRAGKYLEDFDKLLDFILFL